MIAPGIAVRGRRPEQIPDLVDLAAGLVQRGAEHVAGGGETQHRQRLVETLVGDPPVGGAGDLAAAFLVGPVVADAVADDGDLHVFMDDDEPVGDRFEELDPFLGGIQARRPVEQDRLGVDVEPRPLLKLHEVFPLWRR